MSDRNDMNSAARWNTHLSIWKLSATRASEPTAYPGKRCDQPLGGCGLGEELRTDDELDEEEEDVDYKQENDACFARHHGNMQEVVQGRARW